MAATAKAEATLLAAASWCLGFCTMRTGYSIWAARAKAAAATRLVAAPLDRSPIGATTAWALSQWLRGGGAPSCPGGPRGARFAKCRGARPRNCPPPVAQRDGLSCRVAPGCSGCMQGR